MSHDNGISLDLLPEEIRKNRPDECILPVSSGSEDPQVLLRQSVISLLESRNYPRRIRDAILDMMEETLLRYFVDSYRYHQCKPANLLSLSRVTLRKKLGPLRYNMTYSAR